MTVTANPEDSTKAAGPKKGKKVTAQTAEETKTEGTPDQETQKIEDENQKLDEQAAGDAVQKNDGPDETKTEGTPDQETQKTEDEDQKLDEQAAGDAVQTTNNADETQKTEDENLKVDESLGDNPSKDSNQVPDQQIQQAAIQHDMPPEKDETEALGPLELAVLNSGSNTHCNVSRTNLPQNERVVIKYKTPGAKKQAQMNFAQLNALAGKARFEVEG
jgi:hypothetical protein